MKVFTLAKNQTVVKDDVDYTFFSYDTKIANYSEHTGVLEIGKNWNYSKTTLKHFKQFVNDFTNQDYLSKGQFEKILSCDNIDYVINANY